MKFKVGEKIRVLEDITHPIFPGFCEGEEYIISKIEDQLYCVEENNFLGLREHNVELVID